MTVKSPSASNPLGNPASKTHTTSKAKELLSVKFIKGSTDVLVIAPHGVRTEPMDDERTDRVASEIANQLGCSALINDSINRKERDYNRRNIAEKDDEFITNFRSVLDADGATLVLWIHGYDEKNRPVLEKQLGIKENGSLDCLIGVGPQFI